MRERVCLCSNRKCRKCPKALFGNIALCGVSNTVITHHYCYSVVYHTTVGEIYFEESSQSELRGLEFLQCSGDESNLLQCLQRVNPGDLNKRQSSCSTLAGVRCAG